MCVYTISLPTQNVHTFLDVEFWYLYSALCHMCISIYNSIIATRTQIPKTNRPSYTMQFDHYWCIENEYKLLHRCRCLFYMCRKTDAIAKYKFSALCSSKSIHTAVFNVVRSHAYYVHHNSFGSNKCIISIHVIIQNIHMYTHTHTHTLQCN